MKPIEWMAGKCLCVKLRKRRAELLDEADALTKLKQRTAVQDNRIDDCLRTT